jgi:hypothetical protein
MEERGSRLGQDLVAVKKLPIYVRAPAPGVGNPAAHAEVAVDLDRPAVADEDPRGHGREAMPGGEEATSFVKRGRDEASMDEPRGRLVALVEAEAGLVPLGALRGRVRKVDPRRVIAAAPAGWVVMRRDAVQRNPPCWKCALKKFSDPAVAIAADAEISSASVAAATICAKR